MSEQPTPSKEPQQNWHLILVMMAMALMLGSMGINHVVVALEMGRQFRLVLGCVMIGCAVLAVGVSTWELFRRRRGQVPHEKMLIENQKVENDVTNFMLTDDASSPAAKNGKELTCERAKAKKGDK